MGLDTDVQFSQQELRRDQQAAGGVAIVTALKGGIRQIFFEARSVVLSLAYGCAGRLGHRARKRPNRFAML